MARPDPFLNLFKEIGFLPLRLPRSDVAPLNVVEQQDQDLNLIGDLSNALILHPSVTLPPITKDIQTASRIEDQKSSSVKVQIGVTLLGNILQALTGQNLGVSTAFQRAANLRFEFVDVLVDKVDIILLDRVLNQSDIDPDARQIREWFIAGRMGIITATARSKKYVIRAEKDDGTGVAIDVPVIQEVAGGKVKVETSSSDHSEISFEGPVPVAFGVQGIHVSFGEDGKFTAFDPYQAGKEAVRGSYSEPNFLKSTAAFVEVASSPKRTIAAG